MAAKRPAVEPGSGAPPVKRNSLAMSPLDIGPAAGEEDLDIKVLQVQNKKLTECLRERNRSREQLEERIEKYEQTRDNHLRFQVALKQHFTRLRKHLTVAMVAVGGEECDVGVGVGEEVDGVGKMSEWVCECVEKICRGRASDGSPARSPREGGKATQQEDEGSDGDGGGGGGGSTVSEGVSVYSRSLVLLEELTRRYKRERQGEGPHQLQEDLSVMETKMEELQVEVSNLRFSLEQSQTRSDRLEKRLEGALAEIQRRPLSNQASEEGMAPPMEEGNEESGMSTGLGQDGCVASDDKSNTDEADSLLEELTEARELSRSRLEDVQRLSSELVKAKDEMDGLRLDQHQLPVSLVRETPVFRSLQAQFSIAAMECAQMRGLLNDAKCLLMTARQQHFTQLEEIRGEEVKYQLEVREEMGALEGALGALKRDYELLKVEYERTITANDQAGPIARELRIMVDSLQKTISQHKSEVNRYKARTHKAEQQLAKFQEERAKEGGEAVPVAKDMTSDLGKEADEIKLENVPSSEEKMGGVREQVKLLEQQVESYKEACSTEEREMAEVLAAEKKARSQVEELRKRCDDYRKEYEKRKERVREEATRKTKALSEDNRHLQKDLSAKKHEAQALVEEMESATQAFEEMQEQNIRLLQQLKEKDDANFKLMSERIKSNSIHKLLLEEKEIFQSQLNAIAMERQRYGELVSQLEERERTTEATLQSVDKELALQQQSSEVHRKKAQESLQAMAELQLQANSKQKQVESIQETLSNRTKEGEKDTLHLKRSVEEVGALKRKLEKHKSREWMTAGDEVLLEEIKMYKAKLNCPCCSARKKDTVLTKCFHVFCSECIRNRYDSRLRKCPKCGAAFGANDFHKIYLS